MISLPSTEQLSVRLTRKAIRERWPVSDDARARAVLDTEQVLKTPDIDNKTRLLAIRTLLQMDALNLKEKEIEEKSKPKHMIHTNMSMEELEASIKEKLAGLGVTAEELPQLLEYAKLQ